MVGVNDSGQNIQRNRAIDFFKFVFTLIIVLFHLRPLFSAETGQLFGSGRIAVEFFFIVSGYLLTARSQRTELADGIFRENLRMLKGKILHFFPYILIAVICGCVFYSIKDQTTQSLTDKLLFSLSDVYGLQMLGYPFFAATGVAWYLSVLFFVSFLIYPIMIRKRELFTLYIGPVSAIFILGCIAHTSGNLLDPGAWWGWTFKGMLRGYADIVIGCSAYEITRYLNGRENKGAKLYSALELAGIIVTIGYTIFHKDSDRHDFLIIPLIMLAVSISFSNKSVLSHVLRSPVFSKLGVFSFSIYLNHYYVVELFTRGAFSEKTPASRLMICGGIILGLSFLNYFLGKWLAKRINTGERMLFTTLVFICIAIALRLVIR